MANAREHLLVAVMLVGAALGGCTGGSRKPVFDDRPLMESTPPGVPRDDAERLIAKALARAVIEEKDIPGYDSLPDKNNIVVSSRIGSRHGGRGKEYFTAGGLPHSADVSFTLLSPEQIEQRAAHRGSFVYVWVDWLEIKGDRGTVSIGVGLSVSRWDPASLGVTGGYILEYRKVEGDWRFEKVVIGWIN
jgi:hypothetical protein